MVRLQAASAHRSTSGAVAHLWRATAVLLAVIASTVGIGVSSTSSDADASVAAIDQLLVSSQDCNGEVLQSLSPPAGLGLPFLSLAGVDPAVASQDEVGLQSSDIVWLPTTCGPAEDGVQSVGGQADSSDGVSTESVPTSGRKNTPGWSGEVTNGSAWYQEVHMNYQVPSVPTPSSSSTKRLSAVWVGLGSGDTSSDMLVQAGTEENQENGLAVYKPWWEKVPGMSLTPITSFVVHPGDTMNLDVDHSGSGQALIVVEDDTTDRGTAFYTTWSGATIGKNAEWILERPSVNDLLPYLAPINNGTKMVFNSMLARPSGEADLPIADLNRYYIYMTECNNTPAVMADPGSIWANGQSVYMYFVSSGDNNLCGP